MHANVSASSTPSGRVCFLRLQLSFDSLQELHDAIESLKRQATVKDHEPFTVELPLSSATRSIQPTT